MENNSKQSPFDTLPIGETVVLIESHYNLPVGTEITRRAHSWALELPSRRGYRSCGVTIEQAAEHALGGEAVAEIAMHNAIAGVLA